MTQGSLFLATLGWMIEIPLGFFRILFYGFSVVDGVGGVSAVEL
jgi:hypothetical protein